MSSSEETTSRKSSSTTTTADINFPSPIEEDCESGNKSTSSSSSSSPSSTPPSTVSLKHQRRNSSGGEHKTPAASPTAGSLHLPDIPAHLRKTSAGSDISPALSRRGSLHGGLPPPVQVLADPQAYNPRRGSATGSFGLPVPPEWLRAQREKNKEQDKDRTGGGAGPGGGMNIRTPITERKAVLKPLHLGKSYQVRL